MAASVWIRSTRAFCCLPPVSSAGTSRPVPLTMPDVTVDSKPDGLPTATAIWPTRGSPPAKLAAGRSSAVYLDDGDVRGRVRADDLPRLRGPVRKGDLDVARTLDDVVVGDDVAVGAVDHAATETFRPLCPEGGLLNARDVDLYHRGAEHGGDPGNGLVGGDAGRGRLDRLGRLRVALAGIQVDDAEHESERRQREER